jgi:hypothetical protein
MVDIKDIPDLKITPLNYVFENMNYNKKGLWLEFGVATGNTINYISKFKEDTIYGFDSFEGLPETWREGFEKGKFSTNGEFPKVEKNVLLIKGLFQNTLTDFLKNKNEKISFLHVDCDLYSSTKFILEECLPFFEEECLIVFDELVNYKGYEEGELKALTEFIINNNLKYKWIGMNGVATNMGCYRCHQSAALLITI